MNTHNFKKNVVWFCGLIIVGALLLTAVVNDTYGLGPCGAGGSVCDRAEYDSCTGTIRCFRCGICDCFACDTYRAECYQVETTDCKECTWAGEGCNSHCTGLKVCGGRPGETCCGDSGSGGCCKPRGCDSFNNREHCVPDGYCAPCLWKAGSYAVLTSSICNRIDDPCDEPTPDGCSSPFGNNPTGCSSISFLEPCNQHDRCYQTCEQSKGECDAQFGDAINAACAGSNPLCWAACEAWRVAYWAAVVTLGESAYEGDQIKACACCDCE
jgi:hypothetical protein